MTPNISPTSHLHVKNKQEDMEIGCIMQTIGQG